MDNEDNELRQSETDQNNQSNRLIQFGEKIKSINKTKNKKLKFLIKQDAQ